MKKKLHLLVATLMLAGATLVPVPALAADVLNPACDRLPPGQRDQAAACVGNTGQSSSGNDIYGPNGILTRAASLFGIIVGIASIIFIVIGGFKYATSSGDPSNLKSAKDTIMFAVIGILVAVASQSIVVYVLRRI